MESSIPYYRLNKDGSWSLVRDGTRAYNLSATDQSYESFVKLASTASFESGFAPYFCR